MWEACKAGRLPPARVSASHRERGVSGEASSVDQSRASDRWNKHHMSNAALRRIICSNQLVEPYSLLNLECPLERDSSEEAIGTQEMQPVF